mgnify:CR=1 FL=1
MLTGDHATVAHDIASKIGIDQVYSDFITTKIKLHN